MDFFEKIDNSMTVNTFKEIFNRTDHEFFFTNTTPVGKFH